MRAAARADGAAVPAAGFDVRAYAAAAAGDHRSALDLAALAARPLDAPTARCAQALAVLERRTTHRLRTVLVTPTHKDARVTAFLSTWAYEKHWIADALRAVAAAGAPPGDPVSAAASPVDVSERWRARGREVAQRSAPITRALVAGVLGEDVVAVHVASFAADDLVLTALHRGLRDSTDHPALRAALDRLLAVKAGHQEFFAAQAHDRLRLSATARLLARAHLRTAQMPVGAQVLTAPARTALGGVLGAQGAADVDAAVDRLPGLAGLRVGARARARLLRSAR